MAPAFTAQDNYYTHLNPSGLSNISRASSP
jgi:hypothetical protein